MFDNKLYLEDIENIIQSIGNFDFIKNKSVFISGASGMIGSLIVDVLMYVNYKFNCNCTVIANGRNEEFMKSKFERYLNNVNFRLYIQDINNPLNIEEDINFVIHAASNTHPMAYSQDPIGTITTNIIGTNNLLNCAVNKKIEKIIFLSSVEIYGENKGDTDKFEESYLGYINCNTLRAGYPESKRAGEALCQAYIEKYNMNISIVRLARIYGPTMLLSDTKAVSQFIKKAINNEDIVLKSDGSQQYSYLYVADAVSGILKILKDGKNGEAYNLGDSESDITLRQLAQLVANTKKRKVVFDLPSEEEKKGYSTATKAMLNCRKINTELGWKAKYNIKSGIERTISILEKQSL